MRCFKGFGQECFSSVSFIDKLQAALDLVILNILEQNSQGLVQAGDLRASRAHSTRQSQVKHGKFKSDC